MARLPFFRQKVAPQEQRLALHLQQAWRGEARLQKLRLIFGSDVEAGPAKRVEIGEDGVLLLPVGKVARGNSVAVILNFRPDHHQLIGLGKGQGSQQRRVIHREDRRVRADPQRHCQQYRDRQAGISSQQAQTEAEVLKQRLHT